MSDYDYVAEKTKVITAVEAVSSDHQMDAQSRRVLRDLLRNPALVEALASVLAEAELQKDVILGTNFHNSTSIALAAKAQGAAFGMLRAVEIIIENIPETIED